MRKKFLLPLLAVLALPAAVNAEVTNDYILKAQQANKLVSESKYSEMAKICEELIEMSPEYDFGYVCKGIALGFVSKNKRKSRESLKNFTKAIEINPENYAAYFYRGVIQFSMRRRENSKLNTRACSDLKKAYSKNYGPAIDYVKRNKSGLKSSDCTGF